MRRSKSVAHQRGGSISKSLVAGRQSPSVSSSSFRIRTRRSLLSITQAIQKHITKRADIEIVIHYEKYYKQFLSKCKKLQEYLYNSPPDTKQKFMNEDNPHYRYGLQCLMLDLFHQGIIVPGSYTNMRKEAVQAIEAWVLGWIERQLFKESLERQERQQIGIVLRVLEEMEDYLEKIEIEESPF